MEPLDKTLEQSKSLLWGVSIALSWTWGIGIFFTVQMAIQYGLVGLFSFATINAVGLMLFGLCTHTLARRFTSPAHFERHFFESTKGLRGSFFLYQFLAITLTLFAVLKYLFFPMAFPLALVAVMILGLTFFLGEEFNISRIKYLHSYVLVGILVSMVTLLWFVLPNVVTPWLKDPSLETLEKSFAAFMMVGHESTSTPDFAYFMVPIAVGFLLGPWLDLQQWQRAVQINREGLSIAGSYVCGAIIFFTILVFHGILALVIYSANKEAATLVVPAGDGLFHAKDVITRFFLWPANPHISLVGFYIGFICLCALTTFDSGYIALRWYLEDSVRRANSTVMALLPTRLLSSPLIWFFGAAVVSLAAVYLQMELEYFAGFYASFLVVYIVIFHRRVMHDQSRFELPSMKLFSVALFSIALFAVGYFRKQELLMAIAAIAPLFYGIYVSSPAHQRRQGGGQDSGGSAGAGGRGSRVQPTSDLAGDEVSPQPVAQAYEGSQQSASMPVATTPAAPPANIQAAGSNTLSTYFDGKWFVHEFTATYFDTNSVGNVYFGMYAVWVGKTRELFFHHCMPDFDLKKTAYYILTRAFEHKFIQEAREFERIVVKIRVSGTNRKFCTLEHEVFNGGGQMLGKGTQTLLFVSSSDYRIIDIPVEMHLAFAPYL